jgi:hypothetical protein
VKEVAIHLVSKAPDEDSKGAGLVAEAAGDLSGGEVFHEEGSERFVLTLSGVRGCEEEP